MLSWIEISLNVDGELAEAVADVFARFAPDGVVIEQEVEHLQNGTEGISPGRVTVRAYLPVDACIDEKRRKLEEALYFLGLIQPLPVPVYKQIEEQDWMKAWKVHYKPIPIGRQLIILPTWMEAPDTSRIAVKIDPGMAFGTGTHPTTQLCLEIIDEYLPEILRPAGSARLSADPGNTHPFHTRIQQADLDVIDIGCGSGILAIAAVKLGAARVLGVDTDEVALRAARQNARANGVENELCLARGSVNEILTGEFSALPQYGVQGVRQAPLVLSNILASTIIRLFEAGLSRLVAPGGVLVLSGILEDQIESVVEAARARNINLVEQRRSGEWAALVMR